VTYQRGGELGEDTFFIAYCGVVISGHGPSAQGLTEEGVVAVMLDGARVRKKAITTKTACAAKKTIVLRLGIIF